MPDNIYILSVMECSLDSEKLAEDLYAILTSRIPPFEKEDDYMREYLQYSKKLSEDLTLSDEYRGHWHGCEEDMKKLSHLYPGVYTENVTPEEFLIVVGLVAFDSLLVK